MQVTWGFALRPISWWNLKNLLLRHQGVDSGIKKLLIWSTVYKWQQWPTYGMEIKSNEYFIHGFGSSKCSVFEWRMSRKVMQKITQKVYRPCLSGILCYVQLVQFGWIILIYFRSVHIVEWEMAWSSRWSSRIVRWFQILSPSTEDRFGNERSTTTTPNILPTVITPSNGFYIFSNYMDVSKNSGTPKSSICS